MPNRVIRDALLDSDRYHGCPIESRLLFLELLLCADDYGLVPINDVFLRRHTTVCEGKSAAQIAGFLSPMLEHELIFTYTSGTGGRFAMIPRFGNYPRAKKPKWPLPPEPYCKEINRLIGIRTSSAPQMFSNRSANAHETETETETEKKKTKTARAPELPGIPPPPPKPEPTVGTDCWTLGVTVLTESGVNEKLARPYLASLLKQWDEATVLDACRAAMGKAEPKAYMRKWLDDKPKRGERPAAKERGFVAPA
jgi:hypothetical protein